MQGAPHKSDEELFAAMGGGRRSASLAFSELYDRHAPRLFAYCCSILKDDELARDVFQESLAKLYEMARQGESVHHVPALLLRIARNRCLNEVQKRKRSRAVPLADQQFPSHDRPYEQTEFLSLIETALEMLPDDCREAFILKEFAGLGYREVGQVTGVSLTAARSRIFRARRALREILAPYINDLLA